MSVDGPLTLHRAQCQQLLNIIHFQIEQVKISYNTVNATNPVNPFALLVNEEEMLTELEAIKKLCIEINGCYQQADHQILTAMERKIKSNLSELQKMQNTLTVTLQLFTEQKDFVDDEDHATATVFESFATVQDEVKSIRNLNQALTGLLLDGKSINNAQLERYESQDELLTSKTEAFEKIIAEVKGKLVTANIQDAFLTHFFADELTEALQQQLRILLLYRWQSEVTSQGDAIIKKYPEQNLQQCLKLQQLLVKYKLQFYNAYYASQGRNAAARNELFEHVALAVTYGSEATGKRAQITPQQIFAQLETEEQGASDITDKLEGDYRKHTVWQKAMINAAMLVISTPYYQFSEAWLELGEALTDKHTGIYPCDIKLDDDVFGCCAVVGAAGLAGGVSYVSHRTGDSLLGLGIEALRSSLDSCIFYWGNMLGCNSARLVQTLPKTRKVIGIAAGVATATVLCALTGDITAPEATYIIGGYLIGTTARDLSKLYLSGRSDNTIHRALRKASPLINCLVGSVSVYSVCALSGIGSSLTNYVLFSYLASNTCQEAVTVAAYHMQPRLTRLMHRMLDTEKLLKALPVVSWLSGFAIAVGGCAMVVGIRSPYTRDAAFCYFAGSGCQALVTRILDYAKKRAADSDWLQKKFSGFIKVLPSGRWCLGLATTFISGACFAGIDSPTTQYAMLTYAASTTLGSLSKNFFRLQSSTANTIGVSSAVASSILLFGMAEPETNQIVVPTILGYTSSIFVGAVIDACKAKKLSMSSKQQFKHCLEILTIIPKCAAFVFGSNYLAPKVKQTYNRLFRTNLTREESLQLLANQQECLVDTVECKRAAWTILDLPKDASLAEAEKLYRELMLDVHPDVVGGSEQRAAEYNTAIVALRGLNND
ncbi:MAG: J domain-containing protein [Gammaproteobacteria bacterium]|nr:J domain-containing protein [Gammaproteobacteria bacterium]